MSILGYARDNVWEFVLLVASTWACSVLLMDGFYTDPAVQFGPLPAVLCALLCAVLYAAAFKRDKLAIGVAAVAVVVVLIIAGALAFSSSGDPYADVQGNLLWAAICVVVACIAGFALSRTLLGAELWFAFCIICAAFAQMLFESGLLLYTVAVLLASLALLVYRNCRTGEAQDFQAAPSGTGLTRFLVSVLPTLVLIGIACVVWFGVIAPLNPGVVDIELLTEYRKQDITQVRGVGDTQMVVDTSLTSSELVDGERFTTDDLAINQKSETVVEAKSEQAESLLSSGRKSGGGAASGQSGGARDDIDVESPDQRWDAISYTSVVPFLLVLLALVALLVLAVVLYFVWRRSVREKRLARILSEGDARTQVRDLYLFLVEKLGRLGFAVPAGATLTVFAHDAAFRMGSLREETHVPFSVLTDTYTKVAYGNYEPTEDDVVPFVTYYEYFWKAARNHLGNVRYFFKSFRLG